MGGKIFPIVFQVSRNTTSVVCFLCEFNTIICNFKAIRRKKNDHDLQCFTLNFPNSVSCLRQFTPTTTIPIKTECSMQPSLDVSIYFDSYRLPMCILNVGRPQHFTSKISYWRSRSYFLSNETGK